MTAIRARQQVLLERPDKDPATQSRACEHTAILVSLENLLTLARISERVESGSLLLHGWYFDISIGQLCSYAPETACFEPLA